MTRAQARKYDDVVDLSNLFEDSSDSIQCELSVEPENLRESKDFSNPTDLPLCVGKHLAAA